MARAHELRQVRAPRGRGSRGRLVEDGPARRDQDRVAEGRRPLQRVDGPGEADGVARYSDTLYAVRVPGANADWVSKPSLYVPVARWSDGTATKQQWMNVQRVEHSYDGGYSETLTGTLGSITTVA